MASSEQIRKRISDIANSPTNVTYEQIEWVVNQLRSSYEVKERKARHGTLFNIGGQRFMVSGHNPGHKQVKKYCVDDFIGAMVELGLYEE